MDWISAPSGPLRGELAVPGDKSVSHRAVMLAALADGASRIRGFLEGEDTRATAAVFARMGVRVEAPSPGERIVHGVGLHGLAAPERPLDCGNSGTGMRLLAGLLAGQAFDAELVGDASLSRRPMGRVIEPLTAMGASIETEPGGLPPLRIRGGRRLHGIAYAPPVASAQVKSAVLLAGLYAGGETAVRELRPTRDYTERMLGAFGWPVACGPGWARLAGGGGRLRATDVEVPADFSSAAFFIVAATLVPGSELRLRRVGLHPRRTGLLAALRRMGADIREDDPREEGGEPVADLIVRHAPLTGIDLPEALVADMIDEFPALFVAAAAARGSTTIRGADELRVKESDRIAVMAHGLRTLGVRVEERPDGAAIEGGAIGPGEVDSAGDHRCAMAFAVAGLLARGPVRVGNCSNVATSFPGFIDLANGCGFALRTMVDN
ncbi:MAG: 3-phosphoshikimate 1-carboxyvinyltransferase [Mizugakiibacter sp.]|uniref:3-phosphoshikimate 1-carboxyvinyltransferase n=1 Tax=Mizugakiibacter sp. TaxID=1972610 RepID=UPI0031CA2208|nr:3-phosphoshikimate 1-carboxyvinyltransferase [Xanthomonadaceae bacterium]